MTNIPTITRLVLFSHQSDVYWCQIIVSHSALGQSQDFTQPFACKPITWYICIALFRGRKGYFISRLYKVHLVMSDFPFLSSAIPFVHHLNNCDVLWIITRTSEYLISLGRKHELCLCRVFHQSKHVMW